MSDDITRLLGKFMPHATLNKKPAGIKMRYTETLFGAICGQPSTVFYSDEDQVAVVLCASPVIGLSPLFPASLHFVAEISSAHKEISPEKAASYIAAALNEMGTDLLREAVVGSDTPGLAYRVEVDREADTDGNVHRRRATISVEVKQDVIDKHINLLTIQVEAYKRISAASTSQSKH